MVTLSSRSYKLGNKLYLNEHSVGIESEVKPVLPDSINHVFCCDVSGSMYDSLPKMRQQLKNRIDQIVSKDDTITIIAFSSPDVCFVLKELVKVNSPKQLAELQKSIDRYLVPNGWTDFVPPIETTKRLISENPDDIWNWIFLSDGGHNEGPFKDVVEALNGLENSLLNATVIEYGYYADSERLSQMASQLGGTKIMAEDFDSYVPVFESAIKGTVAAPMIEVDMAEMMDNLKYPQFIYINEKSKSVHVVEPKGGKVTIPAYVDTLISISKKVIGENQKTGVQALETLYYALAYVMADQLKYDAVDSILSALGDTKFIDMYQDAFGKQKLFAFQSEVLKATFDKQYRGTIDPNYKSTASKYCIIDFFNDLTASKGLIKVADPAFAYKRISAKAVDKVELTKEEVDKLKKSKTKKDVDKVLDSAKTRSVEMTMINKGYPMSAFTWNEERANLSALMQIDVKLKFPKNNVGLDELDSYVFRNYTIIKDGILNINSLPVILDQNTYDNLLNKYNIEVSDIKTLEDDKVECTIDISKLPVVNRARVRASKMAKMTKLALQLNDYKFELKYLGYLKKGLGTQTTTNKETQSFTQAQLDYFDSLGISMKNGYSPKKELDKDGDYYMATTLNSNFRGFSNIPTVESIDKKLKAGKKLTPAEDYLQKVMAFIDTKYLNNKTGDNYLAAVNSAFSALSIKKNKVQSDLAQMKFAMIVSRKWFSDKESFDDNKDTIVSDFGPELTIEYRFVDKKQNL